MLTRLSADAVERVVRLALEEDAPWGDVTSEALVPVESRAAARLVARETGVLCGEDVFTVAMEMAGAAVAIPEAGSSAALRNDKPKSQGAVVCFAVHDGERFEAGAVLATVEGSARGLLRGERVGLNFVQRLSGIATLTAEYVAAAEGTKARIVDTRKTTPGLRLFERYAVRCGGGFNHRFSLSDAVMAKDNHLALLTAGGVGLTEALRAARARLPHTMHFEVEVDRLDQIEAVLAAGVDTIMLDNFSLADLRAGVEQVAGRALVEASGGVTLERIGEIAGAGVDVISVGALTHSVRALDLGFDF
jgi:nicotinate-nucleotide pyrophosphorylase (carboxylating)